MSCCPHGWPAARCHICSPPPDLEASLDRVLKLIEAKIEAAKDQPIRWWVLAYYKTGAAFVEARCFEEAVAIAILKNIHVANRACQGNLVAAGLPIPAYLRDRIVTPEELAELDKLWALLRG